MPGQGSEVSQALLLAGKKVYCLVSGHLQQGGGVVVCQDEVELLLVGTLQNLGGSLIRWGSDAAFNACNRSASEEARSDMIARPRGVWE